MNAFLIAGFILIGILVIASILHLVGKVSRFKTYANSIVFFIIIIVLSTASWFLYKLAVNTEDKWYFTLLDSIIRAAKGFALGNEESHLGETAEATLGANWFIATKILYLYLSQVACLLFASIAVVSGFIKAAFSKKHNSRVNRHFVAEFFRDFFKKFFTAPSGYSTNILITDLEYQHIKPFLENMSKDLKTKIKVIIPSEFYATQPGQELLEILRLKEIDAYVESINISVIKKFCFFKLPFIKKVNFYCVRYEDLNNLEFSNTAFKFIKTRRGNSLNLKGNINFYISYQDEEFAMNFDLETQSKGAIQLVNEYDWVASKFVYENPITRFYKIDRDHLAQDLKEKPDLHVHFFGFGNINKALLKRMFPAYQLPDDDNQVHYHILDRSGASDGLDKSFLSRYSAFCDLYKGKGFYPQYDFSRFFDAKDIDLMSDEALLNYVDQMVKHIVEVKKDPNNKKKVTNLIFIALSDMRVNVQIANKVRMLIKNVSHAYGDVLHQNSFRKSFIIYPYVKDNSFFRRSNEVMENIYNEVLKRKEQNKDASIDSLVNDIYDNSSFGYGKQFNGQLLYVFENKYLKNDLELLHGLKEKDKNEHIAIMREIRYAQFKREDCPVVVIGRGGYISDPLRGMIYRLAMHVNNNYASSFKDKLKDRNKSLDPVKDKWLKTNYPKKQSNIGLALTFQTKLNLVGYELKWDKQNVSDRFLKIKGNVDKQRQFIEKLPIWCHDFCKIEEDTNKESANELLKPLGFTQKVSEIKRNYADVLPNLSKEMQKRLGKYNDLAVEDVKKEFYEEYEKAYNDYLKDSGSSDKVFNMLKDYFYLLYLSIDNENLKALTAMEHRRWYIESARYGIVPRLPSGVTYNMLTKTPDEGASFCITNSEGLLAYAFDTIKKMAEDKKIFIKSEVISTDIVKDNKNDVKAVKGQDNTWKIFDNKENKEIYDTNIPVDKDWPIKLNVKDGKVIFTNNVPVASLNDLGINAFRFNFNNQDFDEHYLFTNIFKIIFEYDLLAFEQPEKLQNVEQGNKDTTYRFVIRKRDPLL